MGRTATQAADTATFREWASRLAARAPPRDYTEQLHELYNGILARWRYVMEKGEWVHGTPRSLIGHVLGVKYNAPDADPTRVNLDAIPTTEKGFGDCDDVATVVAAGAMALGMTPYFRVSSPPLHVGVVVRTPKGELVSVDPVGHPDHGFNWAAPSRSGRVTYYDMQARSAAQFPWPAPAPFRGIEQMNQAQLMEGFGGYDDREHYPDGTYMSGFDGVPRAKIGRAHMAFVRPTDVRGPRMMAVGQRTMRQLAMGRCPHGAVGVDEFGDAYEYDGHRDLWVQEGTPAANTYTYGEPYADHITRSYPDPFGDAFGRRKRRRGLFKRLRKIAKKVKKHVRKRIKRVAKVVRKISRKVIAPILKSKFAQRVIGAALQAVGIPRRLTAGIMAASGYMIKKIGLRGFVKLLRKNPKKALKMLGKAGRKGLKAATRPLGAGEEESEDRIMQHWVTQSGVEFPSQHIMGFIEAPGMYGQAELAVNDTPTPGGWYRVQKGNTLFGITGQAFGLKAGRERLQMARMINNAAANQPMVDPGSGDNMFPDGKITFRPKFACDPAAAIAGADGRCYPLVWIPAQPGDEPAPEVVVDDVELPDVTDIPEEPAEPVVPGPDPDVPPIVDEPDEPTVMPGEDQDPGTFLPPVVPTATPAAPVEPTPAPDMPDHPEPADPVDVPTPVSPTDPPPGFDEACRKTGMQPVYTAATGWGCVRCGPGEAWDGSQCGPVVIPPRIPDVPDMPEPTEQPTAPERCPPGTRPATAGPNAGQCIPFAPPPQPTPGGPYGPPAPAAGGLGGGLGLAIAAWVLSGGKGF